ncbi:glycosyltransferase [Domibacillus indicus]|uniref:glycosyltransferase n=1 Tax=Domibacillus indicus TaxID=1437523 RepID=UPI000617E677|nr:glycosyltransferase [Domibacillus indicus]
MNRKKVALFLPSLAGGGAERIMLSLAEEFVQSGHEVDLVLAKAEGPYMAHVLPDIHIVDMNSPRVLFSLFPLVRYLKVHRPQSILSALDHANVVAVLASMLARMKTKTVVSIHSNMTHTPSVPSRRLISKWLPPLVKWSFMKADHVVAVSQGVSEDAAAKLKLPEGRIQVIYNPVVDEELIARSKKPAGHPWLDKKEVPVLLGTGRLSPVKDFPNLIRAFARLREERPAKLIILGEGEQREELEKLIQSMGLEQDIDLPGFVSNPYAYMNKADLFVLSSRAEGLPTVLIEALASGTKVVSTDCPSGPKEILKEGKYGPLVPVGDSEALFQAIRSVLDKAGLPKKEEACQPYVKHHVSRQYLEIL